MAFCKYEIGIVPGHKPCVTVRAFIECVENHKESRRGFDWPTLLDTGAPMTVLPGNYQQNVSSGNELVPVSLLGKHKGTNVHLRFKGGKLRKIRGIGGQFKWHIPFKVDLTIPCFGLIRNQTVYFMDQIDHVIIGTDILFGSGSVCLLGDRYRPGRCWLRFFCR